MDSIPGLISGFGDVNYLAIKTEFEMREIDPDRRLALYRKAKVYVATILEIINKETKS